MKKTILFTAAIVIFSALYGTAISQESKENRDTYRLLSLFGDVFERVRASYVEEITDIELIESAINGMLNNLDPHSS